MVKSVCVYCASQPGRNPEFVNQAREIGGRIAQAGLKLIYGGGNTGLMGAVADGAMAGGGAVLGVIPQFLLEVERGKRDITELKVVGDMHERKMAMFNAADAFIILPGGLGTLEELFEVLTWKQLGQHNKPILIHNPAGYYGALKDQIDGMLDAGFLHSWREDLVVWTTDNEAVAQHLIDWTQQGS